MLVSNIRVAWSLIATLLVSAAGTAWADIPRKQDGKPDLTGTYNVSTLTPLQRPTQFGDNLELTPEQAEEMTKAEAAAMAEANRNRGPITEAPPEGGAAPIGSDDSQRESLGAGNVGGYNFFWIDRGSDVALVDGKFRTSILYEPANGRMPQMISLFDINFWYQQLGKSPARRI